MTRVATAKIKSPLERDRVLAILQYLQAAFPRWCWMRVEPASALRARAYRGHGHAQKMPEDAWADGVADIIGVHYTDYPIAFEVKRPGNFQLPSQIVFQAHFEAAGGIYRVVHDTDEVERAMNRWR